MKINKKLMIITSLITLIPIIVGLLLWNQLPDSMATHFNIDGVADGYSSKLFAVLGLPIMLVFVHIFCMFVTKSDPKNENNNEKIMDLVLWICPLVSVCVIGAIYPYNLGYEFNSSIIGTILVSFIFIVIGNYMPKCRQSYTIGIKVPWTLADEENWNMTHRFAGKVWVAGGFVMLITAIIRAKIDIIYIGLLLILTLTPVIYSYLLYRNKHQK